MVLFILIVLFIMYKDMVKRIYNCATSNYIKPKGWTGLATGISLKVLLLADDKKDERMLDKLNKIIPIIGGSDREI